MSCPYNLTGSSAHLSKTIGSKEDENEKIIICDWKVTKQWPPSRPPILQVQMGLWNQCLYCVLTRFIILSLTIALICVKKGGKGQYGPFQICKFRFQKALLNDDIFLFFYPSLSPFLSPSLSHLSLSFSLSTRYNPIV